MGKFEAGDGKGRAGHHNPYMAYVLVLQVPSPYHQCDGEGGGRGRGNCMAVFVQWVGKCTNLVSFDRMVH